MGKTIVFEVSLGTADPAIKAVSYDLIKKDLEEASGLPVWEIFTDKAAADATEAMTFEEALQKAEQEGYENIRIVPIFLTKGDLFYETKHNVESYQDRFDIKISDAVLADRDSTAFAAGILTLCLHMDPDREYVLAAYGNPDSEIMEGSHMLSYEFDNCSISFAADEKVISLTYFKKV